MFRQLTLFIALAAIALGVPLNQAGAADRSLGGGIHYLRNLGDISDGGKLDFSQNSVSLVASGKSDYGLLKVDAQLEYVFDYVGTGKAMWEPSLWLLAGRQIYGGAGIGIGYTDGAWQTNPFYGLRAGVVVPLGGLGLDVYATYRFQKAKELQNLTGEDLDSLTFAALLRFAL